MKNNRNIQLLVSAAVLFIWGFLLHDPFGLFEKNYASAEKFFSFESLNELKTIQVYYGNRKDKEFMRKKDSWYLEYTNKDSKEKNETITYRADAKALNEKIKKLSEIKRYHEVTSDPKKYEEYSVSKEDLSLVITDENDKKVKIFLGKAAATYNSTLVRMSDEEMVFSVRGSLREDWRSDINSYRDKSAFFAKKESIHQIIFAGKNRYRLEKTDNKEWKAIWGITESKVDQKKLGALLQSIESLQGVSFYEKKAGVRVYAKMILMLSNNIEKEMVIYKIAKNEYVFQTTDNPYLMKIQESQMNNLFIPFEEIKQRENDNKPVQ